MKDVYMKEVVRRAYYRDGKSQRQIARELGIHRKTVKKLLEMAPQEIPRYQLEKPKERPVMGPYEQLIEQWLKEDENAPVKQRHSGTRIYRRLCEEYGFTGCERTVRGYVSTVRQKQKEVFVPLAFEPGEMAQVDWGEVIVEQQGQRKKMFAFIMVLNYSGAWYVQLFEQCNQESFFEGHRRAFEFFGGIPRTITYDNLKSAVKKVLKGKERDENERFIAFRTSWLFESRYCNVRRGNEKGLVENRVKAVKRNCFTPVPRFDSLDCFNTELQEKCLAGLKIRQSRQHKTVSEKLNEERSHLLPLPEHPPECCRIVPVKANSSALVQFETNRYSVPSHHAYKALWLKAFIDRIEVTDEQQVVATHPRRYGRYQECIRHEHYHKVLQRKPGAALHLRTTDRVTPIQQADSSASEPPPVYVQPPDLRQYRLLLRSSI